MPTAKRKHVVAQAEVVIPEKIYFRIGEVSALAKLPTYVLRFWETEFPQLRPTKSSTGQRMYRRKDVEFVMQIRKLLYEDGFTIAGARERLREEVARAPFAESARRSASSRKSASEPGRRSGWIGGAERTASRVAVSRAVLSRAAAARTSQRRATELAPATLRGPRTALLNSFHGFQSSAHLRHPYGRLPGHSIRLAVPSAEECTWPCHRESFPSCPCLRICKYRAESSPSTARLARRRRD